MPYRSPVAELRFILDKVVPLAPVAATEKFSEATSDTVEAILTEAGKLCDGVLAPINRNGDLHPAKLENGVVRASPGFKEAFNQIAEGGWVSVAGPAEHGGMGLPLTLAIAVNDLMAGANIALHLHPLLTQGQIDALEHHASDELKALYIPKLASGEWSGTMNLTEPQAGSDVGALRTKAEPNGDGTYSITGQKIFISWGDNDLVSNVCHLVLARLPDGVPGTKGISLFMVPKFIPDENGNPGVANTLKVVSLEHKMGLHGSPTCVMSFEGAKGWLVGGPHKGMAAMFTMMNNARLNVGVEGVGIAEAAYQKALEYAQDRVQFKPIIEHADVRRMLAEMRAETFAARSIAMACAVAIDLGHAANDAAQAARAALLTPIAKAYGTQTGMWVSDQGIQVHGGMGFIEETGAAQFYRDVRVTAIYEGTNGIQAMDLVGRKMMDQGAAAFALLDEVMLDAKAATGFADLATDVEKAASALRAHVEKLLKQDTQDRFAGAVPTLMAFARVLGAHFHLRAAVAAGEGSAYAKLAQVYIKRLLPQAYASMTEAEVGAADLYALSVEDLAI
ncbi:acyl-CoA dehydrogenase [Paenirhodobacter enshiensis]|uniref:acyl-CoA dehydrogenase n=1 Tax=Paenirhodobacter enshiensis TaxID=1105367 RepID=UPI003FA2C7AC